VKVLGALKHMVFESTGRVYLFNVIQVFGAKVFGVFRIHLLEYSVCSSTRCAQVLSKRTQCENTGRVKIFDVIKYSVRTSTRCAPVLSCSIFWCAKLHSVKGFGVFRFHPLKCSVRSSTQCAQVHRKRTQCENTGRVEIFDVITYSVRSSTRCAPVLCCSGSWCAKLLGVKEVGAFRFHLLKCSVRSSTQCESTGRV
jgi:hypothetical protein